MKPSLFRRLSFLLPFLLLASCAGNGTPGATPYIGENGNWWIGGTDTGIKAAATDGEDGAKGSDGKDGKDGKSAFEIYCEEHPDYRGSEKQWLDDLVNGRLGDSNPQDDALAYYPLDDGTYGVGVGTAKYLSNIVIPSSYRGIKVTRIVDEGFANLTNLRTLVMPSTIVTIGEKALYSCRKLKSVVMSSSLTYIGYSWLGESKDLDVYFPIRSIASYFSIRGSVGLYDSRAHLLDSEGNEIVDLVVPGTVSRVPEFCLHGASSLRTVTFEEGVTSIGQYAFRYCYNLYTVDLPSTLSVIGKNAFDECDKLYEVVNRSSIDLRNYSDIGAIKYSSVIRDPSMSDYSIDDDGYLIFDNGVDRTVVSYFGDGTVLALPSNVTKVGANAFYGRKDLVAVLLPPSLKSIESKAFYGCTGLTSIIIPSQVSEITYNAFAGCSRLCEMVDLTPYITILPSYQSPPSGYGTYYQSKASNILADPSESKLSIRDDFVYYDGDRIIDYVGEKDDVFLPEGDYYIEYNAFLDRDWVTRLRMYNKEGYGVYPRIPDSVTDFYVYVRPEQTFNKEFLYCCSYCNVHVMDIYGNELRFYPKNNV